MPIYEYRCQACGRKQSIFFRSLASVDEGTARCERCGSPRLTRLVSRVRVVRAGNASTADASDDGDAMLDEMSGLDESDPRALGRFMRKMAAESGEDMGPEFDEVVGRLEKGEDPEKIEQSMGDVFGDEMGTPDDAPTPDAKPAADAEAKPVARPHRTVKPASAKATPPKRTGGKKGTSSTSKARAKRR